MLRVFGNFARWPESFESGWSAEEGDTSMLRIHTKQHPGLVTLQLEGRLFEPEAAELARVWESVRATQYTKHLQVDLSRVFEVDEFGKEMLGVILRNHTELVASTPNMSKLVQEVEAQEHQQARPLVQ
jgi:ABC-type transporter Mla MlaB component